MSEVRKTGPPLTTFDAVMIVEGVLYPKSQEQVIEAWQLLHDTGIAYKLQGSLGRQAQSMIRQGLIKA